MLHEFLNVLRLVWRAFLKILVHVKNVVYMQLHLCLRDHNYSQIQIQIHFTCDY